MQQRERRQPCYMGRNIRTRLDALKPNIRERVEDKQQDLELSLINSHTRKLHISEEVIARDYCGGKKEMPGVKTTLRGPSTYEVRVAPNTVWRRHIDQLKGSSLHLRSDQGGGQPQTSSAVFTAIPQTTRSIGREVPRSHTPGNIESSSPEKHISPPLSVPRTARWLLPPSSKGTPARRYLLPNHTDDTWLTIVIIAL